MLRPVAGSTERSPGAEPAGGAGAALYLRRIEVADRLGVSVRTVERWALDGSGPPFAMLGRIRSIPSPSWMHGCGRAWSRPLRRFPPRKRRRVHESAQGLCMHVHAGLLTRTVLAGVGLYQPPTPDDGEWSPAEREALGRAAAAMLAWASYDGAVPLPEADRGRAAVAAARACVVQREPTWWPEPQSVGDLTVPVLWGADWFHGWAKARGNAFVGRGLAGIIADAAASVACACHDALDRARDRGELAYRCRVIDQRIAGLARALVRVERPLLVFNVRGDAP